MNAKQYSEKHYKGLPTYQKIAEKAFKSGVESAKPQNVKKIEDALRAKTEELKKLWETIDDPEQFAELIAGL